MNSSASLTTIEFSFDFLHHNTYTCNFISLEKNVNRNLTSRIYNTTINCVQIWVSSSDRTTPLEREIESPVETHTSSLLSGGRAATHARVVSRLLSYTQYDGRVAACTRMESGPPACGPASPRQPFRYFKVGFWAASRRNESSLLLVRITVCTESCLTIGWHTFIWWKNPPKCSSILVWIAEWWNSLLTSHNPKNNWNLSRIFGARFGEKDCGLSTCQLCRWLQLAQLAKGKKSRP